MEDTTGHFSIGVREGGIAGEEDLLLFSQLKQWDFQADRPDRPPPSGITARHGRSAQLTGFMFPLQEGDLIKAFMLMATTQTCCYGPRPQFNQYVLVEIPQPTPFVRFRPVTARGTFFVEPSPQDGYIYRMEAQEVLPAPEMPIPLGPTSLGSEALALDLWDDFASLLHGLAGKGIEEMALPASWSGFLGKVGRLKGNLVGPEGQRENGDLVLGRFAWDGCCTGIPPDPFNSIQVRLASGAPIPASWHKSGELVGVVEEVPAPDRRTKGFLRVRDATFTSLRDAYDDPLRSEVASVPLILQFSKANDLPGLHLLWRGGTNLESRDPEGNTPMHLAARFGFVEQAGFLASLGAQVDARNHQHRTPAHAAAEAGQLETMEVLARHRANLDVQDSRGFTPLAWAIANGKGEMARWLLRRGARVDLPNRKGEFPIHLAVRYNLPEAVRELITGGVSVETRTTGGRTLLELAAEERNASMTGLLRELGAK
ncbi:MAG: DUF3299 domain-containing protein [Candidatus Riflebacteria bacterium]|nr:DUF3299 domain-containing protein [Candidatus Riflebacteria bacterium]